MSVTTRISAERKHFKIDVEASLKGISQNLVNPISKFRERTKAFHVSAGLFWDFRLTISSMLAVD